jgi:hypothetical protein
MKKFGRKFGNPTAGDVHVDTALSEVAIAYKNKQFIADQVFPLVPVDKQSDKYYVWDKGSWLTNQVELRTPGDTYPAARMKLSTDTYFCDIYHLGFPIPDENVKNQDAAIDLETRGSEFLAHQFALNREVQIAAAIFTSGVWDNNPTVGTDFVAWDDEDSSNPPEDIDTWNDTILQNTGVLANTLVIGKQVFSKIRRNPILLDMFKYTGKGILSEAQVAEALGVDRLLIGTCVRRTSLEGASTATQAFVWGKHALLLYVPERPALDEPASGYTFTWNLDDTGLTVNIIPTRQDDRDRDFLKGKHAFDFKVTAADTGVYFANVIS